MPTMLITETFPPKTGGSGRWFWEIYRRLPREDFFIAAGEWPGQEEFDRQHDLQITRLALAFAELGIFSWSGLRGYGRAFFSILRLARTRHIDRVHCGRCLPEGWLAWLLKKAYGIPYICYVHGEEVKLAQGKDDQGVMSSRQLRWITRHVLDQADFMIANSRNTEKILLDEWSLPAEKVRLLHPGVDCSRFTPAPRDPVLRQRLGWADRTVVLTVSRLQKRKGHDRMIQALATIRKSVPDVLYAIVGAGDERPHLEELIVREGVSAHVLFHGELPDDNIVECYQQCDVFVLANRQLGNDIEGFGMVLLEAQACGKPVVAGASGGTAETMSIPATGQVVPCEEPGPLAALLTELLSDPARRARMGDAARAWAVEHFDWSTLSRQAATIFQYNPRHVDGKPLRTQSRDRSEYLTT